MDTCYLFKINLNIFFSGGDNWTSELFQSNPPCLSLNIPRFSLLASRLRFPSQVYNFLIFEFAQTNKLTKIFQLGSFDVWEHISEALLTVFTIKNTWVVNAIFPCTNILWKFKTQSNSYFVSDLQANTFYNLNSSQRPHVHVSAYLNTQIRYIEKQMKH